jgi:hypothetical protein
MSHFNFYLVRHFVAGFLAVCAGFALLGAFHPEVSTKSNQFASVRRAEESEALVLVREAARQIGITSVELVSIDDANAIPILNIWYRLDATTDVVGNAIALTCAVRQIGAFDGHIYNLYTWVVNHSTLTSVFASNVARLDCDNPGSATNPTMILHQPFCSFGFGGGCGGGSMGNQ